MINCNFSPAIENFQLLDLENKLEVAILKKQKKNFQFKHVYSTKLLSKATFFCLFHDNFFVNENILHQLVLKLTDLYRRFPLINSTNFAFHKEAEIFFKNAIQNQVSIDSTGDVYYQAPTKK